MNWETTRCRGSAAPGTPSNCVDLKAPPCVSPGTFRGVCKKIDHFPEDADYEQDTAEYLLRESAAPHIAQSPRVSVWTPGAGMRPIPSSTF